MLKSQKNFVKGILSVISIQIIRSVRSCLFMFGLILSSSTKDTNLL